MSVTNLGQQRAARAQRRKTWEPSVRDLEIFRACCEQRQPLREIGKQFGITHSRVIAIRDRVAQHRAVQLCDQTDAMRAQHTGTLGKIIRECFEAFEATKTRGQQAGEGGSPDVVYLQTAIKALNDIRKIWAIDRVPDRRGPSLGRDDGLHGTRVAGKNQNDVLHALIANLQSKLPTPEAESDRGRLP